MTFLENLEKGLYEWFIQNPEDQFDDIDYNCISMLRVPNFVFVSSWFHNVEIDEYNKFISRVSHFSPFFKNTEESKNERLQNLKIELKKQIINIYGLQQLVILWGSFNKDDNKLDGIGYILFDNFRMEEGFFENGVITGKKRL